MESPARKNLMWAYLVLALGCASILATLFRVYLAFEDPDMGLALEVAGEPSKISYLRGKLFLRMGGNPDHPVLHWGINAPPLVSTVDSGNHELARALVGASSRTTWQKAVRRACDEGRERNEAMIRVLASRDAIEPEQLCSMPMRDEVR